MAGVFLLNTGVLDKYTENNRARKKILVCNGGKKKKKANLTPLHQTH